jgi:HEAT repeat protein
MRACRWIFAWGALICAIGCGRGGSAPATGAEAPVSNAASVISSSSASQEAESTQHTAASVEGQAAKPPTDPKASFHALLEAHRGQRPDVWEKAHSELIELGEAALPVYVEELKSDKRDARELAAMLLAQLGPHAAPAKDALLSVLVDESANVRANAASALSLFPDTGPRILPVLSVLAEHDDLNTRKTAVFALGNLGEHDSAAIPLLTKALADGSPEVQASAADMLGRIGPPAESAAAQLETLTKSGDESVRQAAAAAIARIRPKQPSASDGSQKAAPQ